MTKQTLSQKAFITLILAIIITGLNQGLLLSLLAIILENRGIPSATNSLNALALYIGILVANPFLEYPVRRFGYKPVMLVGVGLIAISTFFFPIWGHLLFWMALRFLIGVGDTMIHFSTQTWVLARSPAHERGRKISYYGFSYALGFGIGPLGINLLKIHLWAPFIALLVLYAIVTWLIIQLKNDYPDEDVEHGTNLGLGMGERLAIVYARYGRVIKYSWFALIPTFLFGYLEASLNNNFPVYALREGISSQWISILLPSFIIGGLIVQIPLGILSDRKGRKKVLIPILILGGLGFLVLPFLMSSEISLLIMLMAIGGVIGSTFSLGVAYAADLLPSSLLANFNIMAGISFGIGSMIGVYLNGLLIQFIDGAYMFYLLGAIYLFSALLGLLFRETKWDAQRDRKVKVAIR